MIERFFFDRVHLDRRHALVGEGQKRAALIFPDAADTPITVGDGAFVGTQAADDPVVFPSCVIERFLHFNR
jgi:hypothetical protein